MSVDDQSQARDTPPSDTRGKDRGPDLAGPAPESDRALETRVESARRSVFMTLDETEAIELLRVLADDDAEGALTFLKKHLMGKAHVLLGGG